MKKTAQNTSHNKHPLLIGLVAASILVTGLYLYQVLSSPHTPKNGLLPRLRTSISTVAPSFSPGPTPTLSPTPVPLTIPHGVISIPPADWLSDSYPFYDSSLDATVYLPHAWSIVNDPSAAGENPHPIKQYCWSSLRKFFKDFNQCPTTVPYALKITPNIRSDKRSFLVLFSVSNGFGGSCNQSIQNGQRKLYDAHITINNHPYVITTAVTTHAAGSQLGIHQDCFHWPSITESGRKSIWAMLNARHWANDDATFIIEMQILDNIKFH